MAIHFSECELYLWMVYPKKTHASFILEHCFEFHSPFFFSSASLNSDSVFKIWLLVGFEFNIGHTFLFWLV